MNAIILRSDARHLPLQDESVDLIVTSPPYFGLRSYTDGGAHYDGQIGSEPTPAAWLTALIDCTREWVRVLKPSGSLFINLGDKYSNGGRTCYDADKKYAHATVKTAVHRQDDGFAPKSLLGLPWRYAINATDQLGLILRAEIIWAKPNGLPESVTDRVRRSHEQIFHFTRQPRYYTAIDEIREPHELSPGVKPPGNRNPTSRAVRPSEVRPAFALSGQREYSPLGKLPGSVWSIPSAPLTVPPSLGVDHFAAYPPALIRPIILGWTPPGICTACGQGRRPTVEPTTEWAAKLADSKNYRGRAQQGWGANGGSQGGFMWHPGQKSGETSQRTISGYVCACRTPDAPTRPSVVLDPFGGTGTTSLVASVYGRHGISVDLSADYCRLAQWRVHDPGERARAMDVPKPPPVPDGMDPLFDVG